MDKRSVGRVTAAVRRLASDAGGVVAIWMALMITALAGIAALGVDVGYAYLMRARLANALDAAGLAMGAAPMNTPTATLQQIGETYLDVNFRQPAGLPATLVATYNADLSTIDLRAATTVPTTLARTVGTNAFEIVVTSQVKRQTKGLELSLVLDNTGSMWSNSNIAAVRDSARILTEILFGASAQHPYLKIGLVPYSVAVNVAPIAAQVVPAQTHPLDTANANTANWKGCVIERQPPHDTDDTTTAVGGSWRQYWWPPAVDNNWSPAEYDRRGRLTQAAIIDTDTARLGNGVHSPNIGCPTPILPLTNDRQTVLNAIAGMTAWNRGGTISSAGMAWGLRMLSPEPPLSEGVAWSDPDWKKAVILMTDGDNLLYNLTGTDGRNSPDSSTGSDWSAYERVNSSFAQSVFGTTNLNTVKTRLNGKLTSVCNAMKAKGILVYTIVFTSGISEDTKNIYRSCASQPAKYFYAPSQQDLRTSFTVIANELSNLRISR